MPIEGQVTGIDAALKAVSRVKSGVAMAIAPALLRCATIIYDRSQRYVPVDSGALKATGTKGVSGVGMAAKADVSYGGPKAPYALYVHEDPNKVHAPPTSHKFLYRAVRETRLACQAVLKRDFQAAIRGSVK